MSPAAWSDGPLQPLRGVTVVDLSRHLPGPWLTRILADLGATVVKVESPRGDPTRGIAPMGSDGVSAFFASLHAGKQSVCVELRAPEGQAVVSALVSQADVLVETFRAGTLAKMGLDDHRLAELNPRLIYCSITGYGQTGPLAHKGGHDINFLARAGILGLSTDAESVPAAPFAQVADLGGGSLPAAVAVLSALSERAETGRGRRLDLSLTRGAVAMGMLALSRATAGLEEPPGQGMLTGGLPCYRCYCTADGRALALGALEPHFFARFCAAIGLPELAPFGLAAGRAGAAAVAQIEARVASRSAAAWLEVFEDIDACVELVRTPTEALAVNADVVQPCGEQSVVGLHLGAPLAAPGSVPALGSHSLSACRALGVDEDIVQQAIVSGALKVAEPD